VHTLKLQLRHLKLSHAHLLNTEDLRPRALDAPERTMRVHLRRGDKARQEVTGLIDYD
jgi:hypothetical protein